MTCHKSDSLCKSRLSERILHKIDKEGGFSSDHCENFSSTCEYYHLAVMEMVADSHVFGDKHDWIFILCLFSLFFFVVV